MTYEGFKDEIVFDLKKIRDEGKINSTEVELIAKELLDNGDNKDHSYLGEQRTVIEYSSYGSKLKNGVGYCFGVFYDKDDKEAKRERKESIERQIEIKNSLDFYQQAPFLTIAKDLLKLIKEDKIERLIFLTAYDERKFPNGDKRKIEIFHNTFAEFAKLHKIECDTKPYEGIHGAELSNVKIKLIELQLIPFDSETQQGTKNASDFDIFIDDNPNICESLIEAMEEERLEWKDHADECYGCSDCHDPETMNITIIAPYYPAVENQHHKEVTLVKNEVSDLKKEDFSVGEEEQDAPKLLKCDKCKSDDTGWFLENCEDCCGTPYGQECCPQYPNVKFRNISDSELIAEIKKRMKKTLDNLKAGNEDDK
ncbi:8033_t:CDS:2, partial [Funneliformis geosporum]